MAGKTDRTGVQYAFKKLSGRANTSNIKSDAQEVIGSNIQVGTQTIFGQDVPLSASRIDFTIYSASNGGAATAEYVVFTVSVITGTTYDADSATGGGGDGSQSAGPHGYKLVMTGNYTALSSNTKKGTYPFTDGTLVHETLGKLQIIPPNFSQESPNPYILKIYEADGSDANQIGDEIPLLDEVDWTFDAYNGILFLQDYDSGKIPAFARGFIYVGDYLSASLGNATGAPGGSNTQVQFNDGGSFAGDSNFTFNKTTDALKVSNISGSLTHLSDGTSYLAAGSNVTITSASNGQITISSTGGGGGGDSGPTFFSSTTNRSIFTTGSTAFVGGQSSPAAPDAASDIGTDVFFFVSGTTGSRTTTNTGSAVFGGDAVVSGSLHSILGLSGSLTRLTDGSSYLAAGSNITILSASNGQITISSTGGTGGGSGDSAAHYVVTEATGSLSNYKLIEAGTGITLTTGSNSVTVSSDLSLIRGRNKDRYTVTASHPADSPFSTPQSDYSQVVYDPDLIDVYLNGMLTVSGTSAQVDSATVDYTVFSSGSLAFAFDLNDEDVVDVVLSQLDPNAGSGSDPAASYLVLSSTGSLSHERVFTVGTGLSATDNGAGNSYVVDVSDSVVATLTGSVFTGGVTVEGPFTSSLGVGTLSTNSSTVHISASNAPSSGSVLVAKSATEASWQQAIVFGEQPSGTKNGANLAFSLDKAPINGTDLMLFVNGLLQLSGTSGDYELTGSTINFKLAPYSDDSISSIYRPSY
jgi:hypothetical protein